MPVLRHSVVETGFSFYEADEVRDISVKRITSATAFDSLNHAVPGGLYDPALGPIENHSTCPTCLLTQRDCPGHMGHIELCVPVFNPLLFPMTFKILRSKCFACHSFRMSAHKVRKFTVQLMLLKAGKLEAALQIDSELEGNGGDLKEDADQALTRQQEILDHYTQIAYLAEHTEGKAQPSSHIRTQQRALIKSFFASLPKTCENCGAQSPNLKKDGYTKIFQMAFSAKAKRSMAAKNITLHPAMENLHEAMETAEGGSSGSDSDIEGVDDEDDQNTSSKYLPCEEVQAQMQQLWIREAPILSQIWSNQRQDPENGWRQFFLQVVPVTPPRFRPPAKLGGLTFEHPQNVYLSKILNVNERIMTQPKAEGGSNATHLAAQLTAWVELQDAVNCLFDSSKAASAQEMPQGIKQILEKKEGLFRKHMMGKRVNSCARSVISPDPYIASTEIGVPMRFAKELTYPQPVTAWNVESLRQAVRNGPDVHPGANFIEEDGMMIDLRKRTAAQREAMSKTLFTSQSTRTAHIEGNLEQRASVHSKRIPKKVYRHLVSGDVLLVNRQPTLHKPGIMAHTARVLRSPGGRGDQQTIRMHYANCNTFNADFDGDEINLHFPQDELARAEAYLIASNEQQYLVPTDGKPLRGLIQDHVDSACILTSKDTFLTRERYQQLMFQGLAAAGLQGEEFGDCDYHTLPPAILKPAVRWTGKQVISSLLLHLARTLGKPPLHLDSKARVPPHAFGALSNEHKVVVRDGQLVQGVFDKGQIGSTEFSIVHAVYELYGARASAYFLNALGRMLTAYLQSAGHSCGIEDLTLTAAAEAERFRLKEAATKQGLQTAASFVELPWVEKGGFKHFQNMCRSLGEQLVKGKDLDQARAKALDGTMAGAMNDAGSAIIKGCLPRGQSRPFPRNYFSLMVWTGAKGSNVNHSQISCLLGQQALEGRRVPVTAAGRTLPCFAPFDPRPRAGGFVADRFLTGVRPAEYYFHCMAGREGLVDTAVKTSRSGYLQRCLVKHLEDLTVAYDRSVRDSEGNMIQMIYGEDGLDPASGRFLNGKDAQFTFLSRNHQALIHKHKLDTEFFEKAGLDVQKTTAYHQQIHKFFEDPKGSDGKISVGDLVKVRRKGGDKTSTKWKPQGKVGKLDVLQGWHTAKVVSIEENEGRPFYRVKYCAVDGSDDGVTKGTSTMPRFVTIKGNKKEGARATTTEVPIIKRLLPDPVQNELLFGASAGHRLGCVSERIQRELENYAASNPNGVLAQAPKAPKVSGGKKRKNGRSASAGEVDEATGLQKSDLELLIWVKYLRDMAAPGENVGTIAAQSVGEPSTQMTLNTFHLAGHGGANVTLGIPRLREIIMTASQNPNTPLMTIPLNATTPAGAKIDRESAEKLAAQLGRLPLVDLLQYGVGGGISVTSQLSHSAGFWSQECTVSLIFCDQEAIEKMYGTDVDSLQETIENAFLRELIALIKLEERRNGGMQAGAGQAAAQGESDAPSKSKSALKSRDVGGSDSDSDDMADEDQAEQGTVRFGNKSEVSGYDDMDDDDRAAQEQTVAALGLASSSDDSDSSSDEGDGGSSDSSSSEEGETNQKSKKHINAELSPPPIVVRDPHYIGGKVQMISDKNTGTRHLQARITLCFPVHVKKLIVTSLVERATERALVHSSKGINRCFVVENDGELCLQTEGINFAKVWGMPGHLQLNKLRANDVYALLCTYGVEAARAAIQTQIRDVFAVYGIGVDPRHLGLLADYMTFDGGYKPLNRAGMQTNASPFLQMSFETTMEFLTNAAVRGQSETLRSPSARIVMGQASFNGTGAFEIQQPLV